MLLAQRLGLLGRSAGSPPVAGLPSGSRQLVQRLQQLVQVALRVADELGPASGRAEVEGLACVLGVMGLLAALGGYGDAVPLIGVGGIANGIDAYAKIRAGASLVQLYTALVYQGPGLIQRLKSEVSSLLAQDGFISVTQAIGVDAR